MTLNEDSPSLEDLMRDRDDPANQWWLGNGEDAEVVDFKIPDPEPITDMLEEQIFANPDKQFATVQAGKPLEWARTFLDDCFYHPDRQTIGKWRDEIYIWRKGAWRKASKDQISKAVYLWGERCFILSGDKQKDFNPDIKKVREVIAASTALSAIENDIPQPSLLGPLEIDPEMAVGMQNGIVDLRKLALIPPSPRFFSTSCNKFDYDANAPRPKQWLRFLSSIWADDPQSIDCLQEMFGYCLTSATAMQKAFMIIGPKRSGKGTIARVLGEVVGMDAMVAPTLASLSTNFGMQPLIGKKVALIADARLSGKTDTAIIAERILSITGEDIQTIDRKSISAWNGKLVSRFVIMSNILPRFMDSSGALTSRFIILKMTNSFFDKEDPFLFDKLKGELPGIFLWALEGLRRLQTRGHFIIPESGKAMTRDMGDLASTVSQFIREECEVGDPSFRVEPKLLYDQWKEWSANRGHRPGNMSTFKTELQSVIPAMGEVRERHDGGRSRYYTGIKLGPWNGMPAGLSSGPDDDLPF